MWQVRFLNSWIDVEECDWYSLQLLLTNCVFRGRRDNVLDFVWRTKRRSHFVHSQSFFLSSFTSRPHTSPVSCRHEDWRKANLQPKANTTPLLIERRCTQLRGPEFSHLTYSTPASGAPVELPARDDQVRKGSTHDDGYRLLLWWSPLRSEVVAWNGLELEDRCEERWSIALKGCLDRFVLRCSTLDTPQ